jgi:hypothetical protein
MDETANKVKAENTRPEMKTLILTDSCVDLGKRLEGYWREERRGEQRRAEERKGTKSMESHFLKK